MVAEVIRGNRIEVVCLAPNKKFKFICKNSRGASGGIIVTYNEDIYNLIDTVEGEFTLTTVLGRKRDGWLQMVPTVYVSNDQQRRPQLWREIRRVRERYSMLWIIGGDFNIIKFMDE